MADDPDETPIDVPMPLVERRRVRSRPFVQPIDERDGIGRQARTAHLEHEDTDAPVEVHAEITGVRALRDRADARMLAVGVSAEVRAAVAPLIEVLAAHQRAGETRSANRDGQVLAARGGSDSGARLDAIDDCITEIHTELDDLRGLRPARSNGKLGTIRASVADVRREVRSIRNGLITVLVIALGGLGAAAKIIDDAADKRGDERAVVRHMREQIDTLTERQDVIRADLMRLRYGIPLATPGTPGATP